jgi:hypothetical protein
MNIKYTKDGRKVCVVGKINATEYIVQEIFVTKSGDEIPSGEKFTTKSLTDEPCETWQARNAAKLEAQIKTLDCELEAMNKTLRNAQEQFKANKTLIASMNKLSEALPEATFETLCGVMSGSYEWAVVEDYRVPKIIPFNETLFCWENSCGARVFDSIKLLTLFGKSDGDVEFRINQYRDGTGSWTSAWFFREKQEAVDYAHGLAVKRIEAQNLSLADMHKLEEMGVTFPPNEKAAIAAYIIEARRKRLNTSEDKHAKEVSKITAEISKCDEILKAVLK